MKIRKLSGRSIFLSLALAIAAVFVLLSFNVNQPWFLGIKSKILHNNLAAGFLHSYHSLRKLPDIVFLPYEFREAKLPRFELAIDNKDLAKLNSTLPENPIDGFLYNEGRSWAKATFRSGDYQADVKVRYRGTLANHWNSFQKSFRIKFPKGQLFNGTDAINLIIPYDRKYFGEPLYFYRAQKFGLNTLNLSFIRLTLNGEDMGVYLMSDWWSDAYIEGKRMEPKTAVYGSDDARSPTTTSVDPTLISVASKPAKLYFNAYAGLAQPDSLQTLMNLVDYADDETFERSINDIFDLKRFYAWNAANILMGNEHVADDLGNMFLIFNSVTGKFELSPWDASVSTLTSNGQLAYNDNKMKLTRRIFSIPAFLKDRNALLESYIKDENQLADDLVFYDNLFSQTKTDFLQDSAKLYNNFQFLAQVKEYRDIISKNFHDAGAIFGLGVDYYRTDESVPARSKLELPGNFKHLLDASQTIDEFLVKNRSFIKYAPDTVVLSPGSHTFIDDVIIPKNLKVVFRAGAVLKFAKGVSLLSYSPITVEGTQRAPVRFMPLVPESHWGVVAVVNTERQESILRHAYFSGGSGAAINGLAFTGSLSFFNSDAEVTNSVVERAGDDDGLNMKFGKLVLKDSVFNNNEFDSIDTDYPLLGAVISGNHINYSTKTVKPDADGIDISWSEIMIANNEISNCSDKGISVGERSRPIITGNRISGCDIGIAVKDLSEAEIDNNQITNVRVGIAAYQKKEIFGGGHAKVKSTSIQARERTYESDSVSKIDVL